MLYLYVETPLHAGTGTGLSSIDLPVQRERTTQYPLVQGSGIKGKLRAAAYQDWGKNEINIVFGPDEQSTEHAGALIAGDARLLLFPVRSLCGVFAFTTSCDILSRFLRDQARSRAQSDWSLEDLGPIPAHTALVTKKANTVALDDALVLEEWSFGVTRHAGVDTIAGWLAAHALPQTPEYAYWREKLKSSLIILPENDFRDFVVHATEVITRVRINRDSKTVDNGALWTEEHLPSDTLLYVPIYATNARKMKQDSNGKNRAEMSASAILEKARSLEASQHGYLQLGGDETVGRGMVRMHWSDLQEEH
jgi:CRISPR-associated protein Cmr4